MFDPGTTLRKTQICFYVVKITFFLYPGVHAGPIQDAKDLVSFNPIMPVSYL